MDVQSDGQRMKTVVFRADASLQIGTGHVMRCLTLAHALKANGTECLFICRAHDGNLIDFIRESGFETKELPMVGKMTGTSHADWLGAPWNIDATQTFDAISGMTVEWLIVDHYALDVSWETLLRPHCTKIMVIDDLADRRHDCDLLLDQNLGRDASDYTGLTPTDCELCIGPHFALLRPEFAELRAFSLHRRTDPQLRQILITMGGVDQDNATGAVLNALATSPLPANAQITVVMGPHAPWLSDMKSTALKMPWPTKVKVGVKDMAQLMADSDLAIGAAGSTSWERCCLGLPSLMLVLADNQKMVAYALQRHGAAIKVELSEEGALPIPSSNELVELSIAARMLVDDLGTAHLLDAMEQA